MIDPNQPAFPVVAFDSRGDLTTTEDFNGLTIRAEIASRLMAAMFANPAMVEVEAHTIVAAALGATYLLIDRINETT